MSTGVDLGGGRVDSEGTMGGRGGFGYPVAPSRAGEKRSPDPVTQKVTRTWMTMVNAKE